MASDTDFRLFTSIRYDPLLLTSSENSKQELNFITPSPLYMLIYHRDRMREAAQHFDFDAVEERLRDGKALHEELLREVERWIEKGNQDGPLKLRVLFDKTANLTVEISITPPVSLSTLYPASLTPPSLAEPKPHPAKPLQPSPLTGGALALGPSDSLPAGNQSSSKEEEEEESQPPQWSLTLDKAATPSSPFTLLKTTNREMYDQARNRSIPPSSNSASASAQREVMLYNEVSELTEGTFTSLYLFRGGRWVTPPVGVPSDEFSSTTLKDGSSNADEGELRRPFAGRWGHSVRSAKVGAGGQRGTSRRWALAKGYCMEETVGIDTVQIGEGIWVSSGVRGFQFGRVGE